ncbi:MAG TPA: ribonuclease HII [Acidaminococcaceae bacterium]|nr:ribonuclease HII [Acidaminococcaceae bacterium]
MKLAEIKAILAGNPTEEQMHEMRQDERAGVQKLLAAYDKKREKERQERLRFANMLSYEKEYMALPGIRYIVGVDEAGRGPLAGPLVIAGVILPENVFIAGLNDSKKLSEAKREALYPEILEKAVAVLVNVVSISNIDKENIYHATQEGMEQILRQIRVRPQVALVDAMHPHVEGIETVPIIHGDALSASIAAASVVAKVTRDRLMEELARVYPQFGLAKNKGYGSQLHMDAIRQFGATKIHRRSYEPIRSMNLSPVEERDNYLFEPENGKEDAGLKALLEDLEA